MVPVGGAEPCRDRSVLISTGAAIRHRSGVKRCFRRLEWALPPSRFWWPAWSRAGPLLKRSGRHSGPTSRRSASRRHSLLFETATATVDPFGSQTYGMALIRGTARGAADVRIMAICVYDKVTNTAEIGGELSDIAGGGMADAGGPMPQTLAWPTLLEPCATECAAALEPLAAADADALRGLQARVVATLPGHRRSRDAYRSGQPGDAHTHCGARRRRSHGRRDGRPALHGVLVRLPRETPARRSDTTNAASAGAWMGC